MCDVITLGLEPGGESTVILFNERTATILNFDLLRYKLVD